jgi:hypothetical protein
MNVVELLSEAKDCVTLREAAQQLSKSIGRSLTEADVLGLALNGHVTLSVFLAKTVADCWAVPDDMPEGNAPDYWADIGQSSIALTVEEIHGIWDVPLVPPGASEVQRAYDELRGLAFTPAATTHRMLVERPGVHCRLRTTAVSSSATSALTPENTFVITVARLDALTTALATLTKASAVVEKPLATKERQSLYIIIAALANGPGVDIFKASKAASTIQATADTLGLEISARNIEEKLKDVVKALDLQKPTT